MRRINVYAPAWAGYTPLLKNIRDLGFDFDLPPVTLAAGTFSFNHYLPVDTDGDYLVREFQFVVFPGAGGPPSVADIRVRLRDGDGQRITSDFIPVADMSGPLVAPIALRRGSVVVVDYQCRGAVPAVVWMLLKGSKRNLCQGDPDDLIPSYTPMYDRVAAPLPGEEHDDFEYPFSFTSLGAADLQKVPLQTDNDSDFLWRGLCGSWNTAGNPVATAGNVALTFYDVGGLPMMDRPLVVPWGSMTAGLFRESVLSSGGGRPAPVYPAIRIPRGSVVLVDISFGGADTVVFSLRGRKIYREAC